MCSDNQSDSRETTSSSLIEDPPNISFKDLTYSVRNGILVGGRKTILSEVSGSFSAGELTVIMGQSGAGKSSLLDILAGYTMPTSGQIFVNGKPRNYKEFRRRSCYIMQDDKVQDLLTIHESLALAARLKLGNHVSNEQKRRRVEELITSLGLNQARNTRVGNLSGGQKKRLAIGLELVSDPPIMFIDEPISGLDSSRSKQIIYLLHLLARQGRTVVVTMHQPSAGLLEMVDRLYAVVGGKCAYIGSVKFLIQYLNQMNLKCPEYHNPVDFLIEICGENSNQLVQYSENGKTKQWITDICKETDRKITIWRDPQHTLTSASIHCAMGLFVGLLFYDIGNEANFVRSNYNFLYFSLMFLMFTAFSGVTITFPEQIPVVRREHFNRWYTAGAYYASTFVAAIPVQTICTVTYACITYWLTGQPPDYRRFLGFCGILTLVSYVALSIGFLNGSMFSVKNGVVFGPFLIMPFTIFSGFFLRYIDAPYLFKWVFHISFLKHGLVGLVLSIYGMDRDKFNCSDISLSNPCFPLYPEQFLIENGMIDEKYLVSYMALFATKVIVLTFSFIILKIRLKSKW